MNFPGPVQSQSAIALSTVKARGSRYDSYAFISTIAYAVLRNRYRIVCRKDPVNYILTYVNTMIGEPSARPSAATGSLSAAMSANANLFG